MHDNTAGLLECVEELSRQVASLRALLKPRNAHTPEATTTEPPTPLLQATSAGITSDSVTEPKNACHRVHAKREIPPVGFNGG